MKQEEINLRISESLKKEFKAICDEEQETMSNKLHSFIVAEVQSKKDKSMKQPISDLLTLLLDIPNGNITVIARPFATILNGQIVDADSEGHTHFVQTFIGDFKDIVNKNKDKKIYLYLAGCDFKNNKFRLFII